MSDIRKICDKYADKKAPLTTILIDIQNAYGYISPDMQQIVAEKTGISISEIHALVQSHSFFRLMPKGKYAIVCCVGKTCFPEGSQQIIDQFSQLLGITTGETTADGLFSLDTQRCLGACGNAPSVSVNGRVYSQMTVDKVAQILAEYRWK